MKTPLDEKALNETALVKSYMDLTGSSESKARGVFMYVCVDREPASGENSHNDKAEGSPDGQ
jgi:hypothetical protein